MTAPEPETVALIALLRDGSTTGAVDRATLKRTGGVQAALEAEHGLLVAIELDRARRELDGWARRGICVLSAFDAGYPANLRGVADRPPLLFVNGSLATSDENSIAVVGTRNPTARGVAAASAIAAHLVGCGYTVTSGLATGIDTAAHMAALDAGGRTVAVIGTGLEHCYPRENAALQAEIASRCAVVSRFWPASHPSRRTFPMRNAVMSGMTLGTVIVEAGPTSGTRTQARHALAQGRAVVLLADLLEQDWAAELAARPGVHVIRRPAEIVEVIEASAAWRRSGRRRGSREPRVMPGLEALTARYERVMLAPAMGFGVCVDCFNMTRGFERCYACSSLEHRLAAVVPISYSVAREPLHQALAGYKRTTGASADRQKLELAAILWRFLAAHERCIAHACAVERFDLVTTVPSSDRERDRRHPLRDIVGELVVPTRERHERLLRRSSAQSVPRSFDPSRYEAVRAVDGARVLLIDDTWTTGANAQSAAAALREAGASEVAAVVIGRHLNRDWHENDLRLRKLKRKFDWSSCPHCDAAVSQADASRRPQAA